MPKSTPRRGRRVQPGEFEDVNHFYTKVLNAQVHPLVSFFLSLSNERIISRYTHLYPNVSREALGTLLKTQPNHFRWAGADLFYATETNKGRSMIVIETNSCPSGQKSMPTPVDREDANGYRQLMQNTIKPVLESHKNLPEGVLCVVYDKNPVEASGYACALSDCMNEPVYLVEFYNGDQDLPMDSDLLGFRINGRLFEVRTEDGKWLTVRAAFRYVTQKPWNRLPVDECDTLVFNPVVVCLAGGRNKLMAAKAYEMFNAMYCSSGLEIRTPETIRDVSLSDVPMWVKALGGVAVVKAPYSNAGQGVYTITSEKELQDFMKIEQDYDQFIVQQLVGNSKWSSTSRRGGQIYHVGTVPDNHNRIYCSDVRMMVQFDYTAKQFRPLAMYSRRAAQPLADSLEGCKFSSWDMLGTNLSIKKSDGTWDSDTNRLLIMDRKEFSRMGIGIDDLIDGYIQTVMATMAIDILSTRLAPSPCTFDLALFQSMNHDPSLISEFMLMSAKDKTEEERKEEEK
mmetsp:Transcript_52510/g.132081  ORF Transcript_52510/g.132081 Transcript_52510/m.132081 type:complete len:512 (+) Transcript_52510:95-1630(+)